MKNWIQQMLLWRKKTDKGRMTLGKVQKEYRENDVCMGELLDALPADGLSIEEAFELAITAKKWADGDRFYRSINDGEPEELYPKITINNNDK